MAGTVDSHRPTERVIKILEFISSSPDEKFSLAEISTALHMPKSSIYPILHTLTSNNYLRQNKQSLRYSLGPVLYQLGMQYVQKTNVYQAIYGVMQEIVDQCAETCHFGELNGNEVLYLYKIDSTESIRMFSAPGRKAPSYCTALGKALICHKSLEELHAMFPGGLEPRTEHTITDIAALYKQLCEVRATHIASECEEHEELIRCFATPIVLGTQVVAAISVTTPTFRFTHEKGERIQSLLLESRPKIERILAANA